MIFRRYSILCIVLLLLPIGIVAQHRVSEKDTVIGRFSGTQKVTYFETEERLVRDGAYSFDAIPLKDLHGDEFRVQDFNVSGAYAAGAPTGEWKIDYITYIVDVLSTKRGRLVELQSKLDGVEKDLTLSMNHGYFHGRAELHKKYFSDGQYQSDDITAEANFVRDTLKGEFRFSDDGVMIVGKTNAMGFLDGVLSLEYPDGATTISETRQYRDGFLTNLTKVDVSTNDTTVSLVFEDVLRKLGQVERQDTSVNYRVSNEWFGENFNLGYRSRDPRVSSQLSGNAHINKHMTIFDSLYNRFDSTANDKAILKLTRRFEFLYPDEEPQTLDELRPALDSLRLRATALRDGPNLQLRKQNSDSLYRDFVLLEHMIGKVDLLNEIVTKMDEGFFRYVFRDEYYREGVDGLKEADTVEYVYQDQELSVPFELNTTISSSDNMLTQMTDYYSGISEAFEKVESRIRSSLTMYDNQEIVDSLDRSIAHYDSLLVEQYGNADRYRGLDLSEVPFAYKMYFSLLEGSLQDLERRYIDQKYSAEQVVGYGESIVCLKAFLTENREALDRIVDMPEIWDDSLFTIYRDNPFDFRKLESRILGGVRHASTILLQHYATQLLNTKNCDQLVLGLERIVALEDRIRFLVDNKENETVHKLDRALRRERVPSRIERILEL